MGCLPTFCIYFYFWQMLREVVNNDWFTVFLVIGLACVAICKYTFANRFRDFTTVLVNSKYLKIYRKEQKFIDAFDGLLFVNLIISISIFFFLIYANLISTSTFEIGQFSKLLFGIGLLFMIKTLFERLIASVFDIDDLIDAYLFQKTTYKNFMGLVLLPLNCFLLYTVRPSATLLYICIAVILLINIIGFLTSFKNYQKLLLGNIFYFILYLCALEIGPYLILMNLITDYKA